MVSERWLAGWCESTLAARPLRVLFRAGQLSRVVGFELSDGRRVVIKVRPFQQRLYGCSQVQARLAGVGFPCPVPIAGPRQVAGFAVSAESMLEGGEQLAPTAGAAPFAKLLARLLGCAPGVAEAPELSPAPPWAAWDHTGGQLWPAADDLGRDLNQVRGPDWLDRAAVAVRGHLLHYRAPAQLGHGDWESQNIRWDGALVRAVHDWDSVLAQPEAAIVGMASAVWPARGKPGEAATVGQSAAFLDAYAQTRGHRWADADSAAAWAAGLWVRLFNAKKDAFAGKGPQLSRLATELGDRLALAGLTAHPRRPDRTR